MSEAIPATSVRYRKNGDVREADVADFQHTPLGKFIIYRLRNKYDVKLLVTGDVGEGKTSLGVAMARWTRRIANDIFDRLRVWDVERDAGLDVWDYFSTYKQAAPGDALVIDEMQEAADRRRSNRNENVFLSWAWMKLRVRQVVTIGIMPTTSALDRRLLELADVRLHIYKRGKAVPYYLFTEPFEPYQTYHLPFRRGNLRQQVTWPDLSGDEDYERLHEMKEETGVPGADDSDHLTSADVDERLRKEKQKMVGRGLKLMDGGEEEWLELQSDLAQVLDLDPSTVSKYKREMELEA